SAVGGGFQASACLRRGENGQRWHLRAAALVALASCPLVWSLGTYETVLPRLGGTLLLGLLAALAATRLGDGRWLLATVLVLPGVQATTAHDNLPHLPL